MAVHSTALSWANGLSVKAAVLTAAAAVLSNLVSNVPAVLLFKPLVPKFAEPTRAWLVVSGNLTILGSVANLIVVEAARRAGVRVGFASVCPSRS